MTAIHVFLDDARKCPDGFVAARTAEECILLLQECEVDILSLDYELGWGQPKGSAVAEWLARTGRFPRRIYLHTSSPAGRQLMYQLLSSALPDNVYLHGGPMPYEVMMEAAQHVENVSESDGAQGEKSDDQADKH